MPIFTVPSTASPQLAKDFLRRHAGISLTLWRKIKNADNFYVNNIKVKPTIALVKPSDTISYTIALATSIIPVDIPINIAYEDEYLLILDKPAGQLVHPTTKEHHHTLANGVLAYYAKQQKNYAYHPVHRLDKNTSGLVLIAKFPHIQHLLSSFGKNFKRTYQAVVTGQPTPAQGTICAPIARHPNSIIQRIVSATGQESITHYRTLKNNPTMSLLEISLETGRTHQIRVHLAHIGHPLLGDDLYGGATDCITRQALHATQLELLHPVSKKTLCLNSVLAADLQNLIK